MMSQKILGHEKIEKFLSQALLDDKVYPAWIFYGPRGIGKTMIAINFAKCLLTDRHISNHDLKSDDADVNRMIDNRVHPDFFLLENSDNDASIDDVRELFSKIKMSPSLSKRRVVILKNASSFNKNIYNSLLKVLEEPPSDTIIILICTTIGNIPKTLLSRVLKIKFHPLELNNVKGYLLDNKIENAEALANISAGSIGMALKLNEVDGLSLYNALVDCFNTRNLKHVLQILGSNDYDFSVIKLCLFDILKRKLALESCNKIDNIWHIIQLLDRCEIYGLDKKSVVVSVYEQFFD